TCGHAATNAYAFGSKAVTPPSSVEDGGEWSGAKGDSLLHDSPFDDAGDRDPLEAVGEVVCIREDPPGFARVVRRCEAKMEEDVRRLRAACHVGARHDLGNIVTLDLRTSGRLSKPLGEAIDRGARALSNEHELRVRQRSSRVPVAFDDVRRR